MEPFILRDRKVALPIDVDSDESVYDSVRQIWIRRDSGEAMVACLLEDRLSTKVGETTMTATREGVDQTERSAQDYDSGYSEGCSSEELTGIQASRVGETSITETREGVDQTERVGRLESDAAYSHF